MMDRKLAYAIINVVECGINLTDRVILSHPTESVIAARNVVYDGTVDESFALCNLLDKVYLKVYGNALTSNYYVKALDVLSDKRACAALDAAVKYLAEDKCMKDVLKYPFSEVMIEALMDDTE